MKQLFLFLLVLTVQQSYSQCDSFAINFDVIDIAQDTLVCSPSATVFQDLSTHNYKDESVKFEWSFEDGPIKSVLQNPARTFFDPGSYDVTFFAETSNGCKDSITKKDFITVVGPKVVFNLLNDSLCQGDSLFVELDITSATPAIAIVSVGNVSVNATSKRTRIGLLVDTKSSGTQEVTASISSEIVNPLTDIVMDCTDKYPNVASGEDSVLAYVYGPLPDLIVRGWPNTGLYLSNKNDYTQYYWLFEGDTFRTDTFKTTSNGDLTLVAFNGTCQISKSWNSVGIDKEPSVAYDMRFSQLESKLTLSHATNHFEVYIYNTNGQLVASENTVNGSVSMDLSHLQRGVYLVSAQAEDGLWSTSIMR